MRSTLFTFVPHVLLAGAGGLLACSVTGDDAARPDTVEDDRDGVLRRHPERARGHDEVESGSRRRRYTGRRAGRGDTGRHVLGPGPVDVEDRHLRGARLGECEGDGGSGPADIYLDFTEGDLPAVDAATPVADANVVPDAGVVDAP